MKSVSLQSCLMTAGMGSQDEQEGIEGTVRERVC